MRIEWFFITNLTFFTQGCFAPDLVEIAPVALEKKIFNSVNCSVFLLFGNVLPLEKGGPFIWTNLNTLYPRMHCAKFGWNWLSGSGEDFFNFFNVFLPFGNYLPLERGGGFIWTNLNPHHPRMLCAKFGWNWPSGSGKIF